MKREVIHRLCIGPMSHSELSKSLPLSDYNNEETADIDAIIASVSNFKRPGVNSRGLYELRDEFYSHYSPFFYHYNRIDQSKAEEQLRKHAKKNNLPKVTPPPFPPEFSEPFKNAVNVLCSKTLVQALTNILSRPMMDNSKSWSDTLIQQALHLIGLALHEETRQREMQTVGSSFDFITMAKCENLLADKPSLFDTLESLQGHRNVEEHASLLQWVLKKFRKEVNFREAKDHSPSLNDPNAEDLTCHKTAAMKKFDKEKRKKLAQERRAKVMQQMSAMQKAFIQENAELFAATDTSSVSVSGESCVDGARSAEAALQQAPVALGKHHSAPSQVVSEPVTCILCQEEQDVSIEGCRSVVLTAFVQRSSILSHVRTKKLENGEDFDPLFSPSDIFWGIHSGSCGHTMHSDCWQRYFDSVLAKEGRGSRWQHYSAIDTSSHEFLCPLCKCLSNAVLPLLPPLIPSPNVSASDVVSEQADSSWADILASLQTVHSRMKVDLDKSDPMEALSFFNKTCEATQSLYLRFKKGMKMSDRNVEMIRLFAQSVYTVGLSVNPNEYEARVPVTSWSSCAYTIQTIECVLRSEKKPIFGGVPSRQLEFLNFFARYASTVGGQSSQNHVKQHCLKMLAATSPENIPGVEIPSIMDIDLFAYMVKLRSALPSLYFVADPNSSSTIPELHELSIDSVDQFVFQLSLAAFLVQVLLTTPEDLQLKDSEMGHDRSTMGDQGDRLAHVWATLRQFVGLQSNHPPHPSPWQLYCHVLNQLLPFLRCSALFYHCLTGVHTAPTPDGDGCTNKEYLDLCHYLNMSSTVTDALSWDHAHQNISSPLVAKAARRWCSHSKIRTILSTVTAEPLGYGVTVSKLIDLPEDFSELINRASQFSCPNSSGDDSSRMPTLCLVCNEMLCSQSYCCQTTYFDQPVGACTAHVHKCGDGVGVFLRVRECQILLLSMTGRKKGCFCAPPYLDVYGEIDIGLRRGNPLYLCPERYTELQRLWSTHRIQETIAHSLELNRNLFSIDWAHF